MQRRYKPLAGGVTGFTINLPGTDVAAPRAYDCPLTGGRWPAAAREGLVNETALQIE